MRQFQHVAVRGRFLENVAFAADVADERHDHLFANRIDGRIGHLSKELLEVIEERLRLIRETSERRVGSHRADRLLPLGRHRREYHSQIFIAIAKRTLPAEQRLGIGVVHARGLGQLVDRDLIFLEPLRVGLL